MLNAFRHQRTSHGQIEHEYQQQLTACSTPFGINERVTAGCGSGMTLTGRCSTPFGINERVTCPSRRQPRQRRRVLNAFRHQRTSHRPIFCAAWIVVPVLNAFRHQRTSHLVGFHSSRNRSRVLNAFRHQRTSHRCDDYAMIINLFVLNAFRHQRTSHEVIS